MPPARQPALQALPRRLPVHRGTVFALAFALAINATRNHRRQVTGARFDQSAARRLYFFSRDRDVRIVRARDLNRLLDPVMGRRAGSRGNR